MRNKGSYYEGFEDSGGATNSKFLVDEFVDKVLDLLP